MDQNLSWDLQCNEVCKHKKFGLMKRLYSFYLYPLYLPYISHLYSHILTTVSLLGKTVPLNILVASKKIQNRIACFLTQKYDYILYPSGTLRNELGWMSVSERYKIILDVYFHV